MKTENQTDSILTNPQFGFDKGLTLEHVLLSITIVSTKESCGQFDDSCSFILERALKEYNGVVNVDSKVLYQHTKIEQHTNECECGYCKPAPVAGKNEGQQ